MLQLHLRLWGNLYNVYWCLCRYTCSWSKKFFCRFFSYSLDNRIIPRHKILVENRINFKLRYMLAGPDDEFYKRVEAAIERRRRFESGIMDINPQTQTTNSSSEQKVKLILQKWETHKTLCYYTPDHQCINVPFFFLCLLVYKCSYQKWSYPLFWFLISPLCQHWNISHIRPLKSF